MTVGLELIGALLLILVAAEVFTNALEHFGERIGISEGVTGSLFAAVGTAMPESMVPLVAIFAGTANAHVNEEIGVGAILGAPLMLSTLSIALMGLSVLKRRGLSGHLRPEKTGLQRDLMFFLIAFAMSFAALWLPMEPKGLRVFVAVALMVTYFIYVLITLRVSAKLVEEGHGTQADGVMFLSRLGLKTNMPLIVIQMALGLALLVGGAKTFVHGVEQFSHVVGISPLLLSLLIVPIATELPEKVNSILWIRRGKDTLAFGNITGAMVFQGSLLPAIGLLLTPWTPNHEVLIGIVVAYAAATWLYVLARRGDLRVWHLILNLVLYVGYVAVMLLH